MSNTICSSNITSGFIDLATFDEIEKYLYGCGDAVAYFVRTTCKSTWFTQVPVILSNASGQAKFGQNWSVSISRAGDYLLQTWLRVGLPNVTGTAGTRLRWTRNLMHNLVKEVCITFNDLVAARFDNHHLDFWAAFTVPAGKQVGYNRMIGNTVALTNPTGGVLLDPGANQLPPAKFNPGTGASLAAAQPDVTFLNLPLPFFYSRDSGVALPTAALPYNDMRINFSFRDWNELLVGELATNNSNTEYRFVPTLTQVGGTAPALTTVQVWANYAIVSNDERKRMACAPRDILIEQAQMSNAQAFTPTSVSAPSIDIRLSHAIKVLFFAVKNTTFANEHSTYTVGSPQMGTLAEVPDKYGGQYAVDPLANTSLVYENTNRLGQMGSDYYSLLNPYYSAPVIPESAGLHCYSYALDFICLDPMGSTNYGKLTNVSIVPAASTLAIAANSTAAGSATTLPLTGGAAEVPGLANGSGVNITQTYSFILTCVNMNVVRISGGALGFPIL